MQYRIDKKFIEYDFQIEQSGIIELAVNILQAVQQTLHNDPYIVYIAGHKVTVNVQTFQAVPRP
jgi:hypothetical protein